MNHLAATGTWADDWYWGMGLIVFSMVMHAIGLAVIGELLVRVFRSAGSRPVAHPLIRFAAATAITALLLVCLHGLEASLWAAVLVWLNAMPDFKSAIYFSLQMATTLGTDVVQLEERWKLMGPLEAIGGMLLFGFSTAFLLAVTQRVWPFPQSVKGVDATAPD